MSADANREGFRVLRSESALLPVELLWRWSFGLGLLALSFFVYAHMRQAVFLSDADELAIRGHDPIIAAATVWEFLAGAKGPLLRALEPALSAALVLWHAARDKPAVETNAPVALVYPHSAAASSLASSSNTVRKLVRWVASVTKPVYMPCM